MRRGNSRPIRRIFRLPPIRALIIAAGVLAVGAAGLFLYRTLGGSPLLGATGIVSRLGSFFYRSETTAASSVLLESVTDVFRLETVEHVRKLVFPYDFFPNGVDAASLERKLSDLSRGKEITLTLAEQEYDDTRRLARELGLVPGRNPGFLVVTVIVRAGFRLPAPTDEPSRSTRICAPELRIERDGSDRTAYLRMPPPVITSIAIEDPATSGYPYPDVALTPELWKRLAAFVEERAVRLSIGDGILLEAERRGRRFAQEFLAQAGFTRTIFIED